MRNSEDPSVDSVNRSTDPGLTTNKSVEQTTARPQSLVRTLLLLLLLTVGCIWVASQLVSPVNLYYCALVHFRNIPENQLKILDLSDPAARYVLLRTIEKDEHFSSELAASRLQFWAKSLDLEFAGRHLNDERFSVRLLSLKIYNARNAKVGAKLDASSLPVRMDRKERKAYCAELFKQKPLLALKTYSNLSRRESRNSGQGRESAFRQAANSRLQNDRHSAELVHFGLQSRRKDDHIALKVIQKHCLAEVSLQRIYHCLLAETQFKRNRFKNRQVKKNQVKGAFTSDMLTRVREILALLRTTKVSAEQLKYAQIMASSQIFKLSLVKKQKALISILDYDVTWIRQALDQAVLDCLHSSQPDSWGLAWSRFSAIRELLNQVADCLENVPASQNERLEYQQKMSLLRLQASEYQSLLELLESFNEPIATETESNELRIPIRLSREAFLRQQYLRWLKSKSVTLLRLRDYRDKLNIADLARWLEVKYSMFVEVGCYDLLIPKDQSKFARKLVVLKDYEAFLDKAWVLLYRIQLLQKFKSQLIETKSDSANFKRGDKNSYADCLEEIYSALKQYRAEKRVKRNWSEFQRAYQAAIFSQSLRTKVFKDSDRFRDIEFYDSEIRKILKSKS